MIQDPHHSSWVHFSSWLAPSSGFQPWSPEVPGSSIIVNTVLNLNTSSHRAPQRGEGLYSRIPSGNSLDSLIPVAHANQVSRFALEVQSISSQSTWLGIGGLVLPHRRRKKGERVQNISHELCRTFCFKEKAFRRRNWCRDKDYSLFHIMFTTSDLARPSPGGKMKDICSI